MACVQDQAGLRVCVLKGFAHGIDPRASRVVLDQIVADIVARAYDVYAWDGDALQPGSFTAVLDAVARRDHRAHAGMFKAFRITGAPTAFLKSFEHPAIRGASVQFVDVSNKADFAQLGIRALQSLLHQPTTAHVDVHFVGGGAIAQQEYAALQAEPAARGRATCRIWDVTRIVKKSPQRTGLWPAGQRGPCYVHAL